MTMHDIPDPPPEFEDEKLYCCVMECFFTEGPATGCEQPYWGIAKCCKTGAEIKAWQDGGGECEKWGGLCGEAGFAAQRLKYAAGPYTVPGDCFDACPMSAENGTSYGVERARAAHCLAHTYNLMPIDPGSFSINQVDTDEYNFIISAKKDASNCLIAFNMDELDI